MQRTLADLMTMIVVGNLGRCLGCDEIVDNVDRMSDRRNRSIKRIHPELYLMISSSISVSLLQFSKRSIACDWQNANHPSTRPVQNAV